MRREAFTLAISAFLMLTSVVALRSHRADLAGDGTPAVDRCLIGGEGATLSRGSAAHVGNRSVGRA